MAKITLCDNGQPNPLTTLTRRAAFAALSIPAIVTALPTPSMCVEPDPIFGLIDAHREARRRQIEAIRAGDDDWEELTEAALAAQIEVLTTAPTTVSEAVAALRWCVELGEEECAAFAPSEWADEDAAEAGAQFLPMLASALERLQT